MSYVKQGTFALLSDRLLVTDPCYAPGTHGTHEVRARKGVWDVYVKTMPGEKTGWGSRVAELVIKSRGYQPEGAREYAEEQPRPEEFTELVGSAGVDSGQCGFFCAETYAKQFKSEHGEPGFYGTVCELTSAGDYLSAAMMGFGCASSSGFGDGGYECYVSRGNDAAYQQRDVVTGARLVFISEEELESEDEESNE